MSSYVGKRIVPKHCGEWNPGRQYEMLSIVYVPDTGDSFISRREVPAGTELENEQYWALCANFSDQIATAVAMMMAAKDAMDHSAMVLNARIDNLIAEEAVDADSEMWDARVDSEGVVYPYLQLEYGTVYSTARRIADRSISGHYHNHTVTKVGDYGLYYCKNLLSIELPNVTELGVGAFYECTGVTEIDVPKLRVINNNSFRNCSKVKKLSFSELTVVQNAFQYCSALARVELAKATEIAADAFLGCTALETVIIRTTSICALKSVNVFAQTKIKNNQGYIYVPRDLVETYKVSTNWVTYADRLRVIEDYPEICGGAA